jgi:hypothetical protein
MGMDRETAKDNIVSIYFFHFSEVQHFFITSNGLVYRSRYFFRVTGVRQVGDQYPHLRFPLGFRSLCLILAWFEDLFNQRILQKRFFYRALWTLNDLRKTLKEKDF